METLDDLLPGLLTASFRGASFHCVDVSHAAGRRIHTTWFPGLDLKAHDDTGVSEGPFEVAGFVIGDDYVMKARALEAAFRAPGPGLFRHPWLGGMLCVVVRPGRITFSTGELRVARVEVSLDRAAPPGGLARLAAGLMLPVAAANLIAAGVALATAALSGRPLPMALAVAGLAVLTSGRDAVLAVANASRPVVSLLDQVQAFDAAISGTGAARAAPQALAALASRLGAALRPTVAGPVSPATLPVAMALPEPLAGARALLAAAERMTVTGASGVAAEGARAGVAVLLIGEGLATIAAATPESRQDADALAALAGRTAEAIRANLMALAVLAPGLAAPPLAALDQAVSAVMTDLSRVAGRLPAVEAMELAEPVPAWLLAQKLAGGDGTAVLSARRDVVRRNRLRHPARAGAGRIEVLRTGGLT